MIPFFANWDYWVLNQKVTFDPFNLLINIAPDVTEIDIQTDVYSNFKEWLKLRDNLKYPNAIETVGGDLLPDGNPLGRSFFLTNGWRILLDHGVAFNGNLYSRDYDSPFYVLPGIQLATTKVSNLVDIVQTAAGLSPADISSAVWANSGSFDDGSKAEVIDAILRLAKFIAVR